MESIQVLIGAAVFVPLVLAAFAGYRWRQLQRTRQINGRVKDFLSARYGELPSDLHIISSDDTLWPVLVSFHSPRGGIRHLLQFDCPGPASTLSFRSEEKCENRQPPAAHENAPDGTSRRGEQLSSARPPLVAGGEDVMVAGKSRNVAESKDQSCGTS
jgi:hypothetical protein